MLDKTIKRVIGAWATALCIAASIGAAAQAPLDRLQAYADCTFSDGLMVVHTDVLPPGVTSRPVETDDGIRRIDMEAGMRIMFAYPLTDFYANVKAERLPVASYSEEKKDLLANFEHMAHGNTINTSLQSPINGFEAHGLDRDKLEGGVLGIYLLFRDSDSTVTTIYLLNQEPPTRQFQTIEDYRKLRDRFLSTYTACINDNLAHLN
jgi:hypothetical protein